MRDPQSPTSLQELSLRRPFIPIALALILGIVLHSHLPPIPKLFLFLSIGLLVGAVIASPWRHIADSSLLLSILFAGVTAGQIEHFFFPAHHIAHYTDSDRRLARIECTIDQPPRLLTSDITAQRKLPPRQVTSARVLRILATDGWQPASGSLLLHLDEPREDLGVNHRISALGMLSRPRPAMNPAGCVALYPWQHDSAEAQRLA